MNFLSKFVALLLLESVLIGGLFMYISTDTLTTGYLHSVLRIEPTWNFFFVPFLLITLIVVVGISLAGMTVFIVLSHRIAGPIYRFEKVLGQLQNGDLTAVVHLRSTDQLLELEKTLNAVIDMLAKRIGIMKNRLDEAQECLGQTKNPELISNVKQKLDRIEDEINHFKVPADSPGRQ